jgi:lipooligosaccharide transport system permease protein
MATPAAVRIAERELLLYRRIWRENVIGAFVQPFLYLVGVGVGVGSLIDDGGDRAAILGETSYFAFYATALLATTAMFNTSQEALWPTMDGFRWSNAFRGMIGTPLEPRDLATAFLLTFGGRALVTSGGVACVLALFPSTRSLGLFGAVPAAVLCGLAFAMPIAAWTGSRDVDNTFPAILRFVVMPMFLFGGAFYPVEQLPRALEVIAWFTPLWHAIELCRELVLGGVDTGSAVGHVSVLVSYIAAGWLACTIVFDRRLRP